MTREEKTIIINTLAEKLTQYPHFYLTDISDLNAQQTADLRRECFLKEVNLVVVKNTLFGKALEKAEKADGDLVSTLTGNSAVMFTHTNKVPALLIKEFRKKNPKPILKAAYVEESFYVGEGTLEDLIKIKTKEEVVGDIIMLLQSPMKQVISALQGSAGHKIAGIVKALEERNN